MKSITVKFSAILMILGAFAAVSFGQKTERVKFAKGETSGDYTRTIPANGSIDFVINARAGQYMDYTVAYDFTKTDLEAALSEPGLQDIAQMPTIDARNVFKINISGDHRLTVNNLTRKSVTITLYLGIFDKDPDVDDSDMSSGNTNDEAERIELPKNEVSIDFPITIEPGETRKFVAFVKKNHKVCVRPSRKLGSSVKIEVDSKLLNTGNSAMNEDCSAYATSGRDHYIYFENTGRSRVSFDVQIGFYIP